MKILKIELQNINSLKSETPIIIDFESDSFKDVGLFAITGSTGAGKTTILDAITIALYREVARFNRSNIKAGLLDVVSYGANDAFSRVTFETKGLRYEAQWHIRLATKTGKKLSNPNETVYLKNLSEEKILAETKKEVDAEIERITQLTYQQFLRSVLLAQGEFAAFLSADAKEKGNLLQQIAGEEIYLKIGEVLLSRINSEQKELERIKAKINIDDLLSEDKCKELQEEEIANALKTNNLQLEQKELERILTWFEKNGELTKKQDELAKEELEIAAEIEIHQQLLVRLKLHDSAEPFKTGMDELLRIDKEQFKRKEFAQELKFSLENLDSKLEAALKSEVISNQCNSEAQALRNNWLPKLLDVTKIDTEITNATTLLTSNKTLCANLITAINSLQENSKTKEIELSRDKTHGLELEKFLEHHQTDQELEKHLSNWNSALTLRKSHVESITNYNQQLHLGEKELADTQGEMVNAERIFTAENDLLDGLNTEMKKITDTLELNQLSVLLQKQKNLETKKIAWTDLAQLAGNYQELNETKTALINEYKSYQKIDHELNESNTSLDGNLSAAQNSLNDAEKILELEQTILSFDQERKKLEKGKACSLCGATDHPFVEKYAKLEISASKKSVETRKKIVEQLQKELKNIEMKRVENRTKLASVNTQITTNQQQLDKVVIRFNQIESEFIIENQRAIIEAIEPLKKEISLLADQIEAAQKLQHQKDEKTIQLTKKRELIANQQTKIKVLDAKKQSISTHLLKNAADLNDLIIINETNEINLAEQLSTFKLSLPTVENSRTFIRELEQKATQFQLKTKELAELNSNIKLLLSDINNNETQIKEKNVAHLKTDAENTILTNKVSGLSVDRNDLLPLEISTKVKQNELDLLVEKTKAELERTTVELNRLKTHKATSSKELETSEKELTELNISHNTLTLSLEEQLKNSDFMSLLEIEAALLKAEEKEKCGAVRKKIDERSISYQTLVSDLKVGFARQALEKNFEIELEEAQTKLLDSIERRDLIINKTGEIRKQLEIDRQFKNRNKELVAEFLLQEQKLKTWLQLKELLGKSKESFNTYVQRLTLKNLINLANLHLFKLNKRYSLKLNENYKEGEELNFMLVDHYQTDEARYVDTSSGGEKFLISLALALGLSDLSSHNVNIGSLFIDEGFGTLDNNTLETVIATLETLQSQGKMIGIISHVENLKERIPVQIQVTKRNNGVSVINY